MIGGMRGTVELGVFLRDPFGCYLVGQQWVYWCARPDLFGFFMWGRPDADSVRALCRAMVVEFEPAVPPHHSLVDVSRLESVDGDAFSVLDAYVRTHHDVLQRQVTQLALVRPLGMAGAIAAGFYEVMDAPYPVGVFEDVEHALGWLQGEVDSAFVAELQGILEGQTAVAPVVGQLRALLVERLGPAAAASGAARARDSVDIGASAQALGLSPRTLQRRLRAAETTFQKELVAARVRVAQRRMLESDASLTAIAIDAGFTSPQHMATAFRRVTGQTPSAWRQERGESDK